MKKEVTIKTALEDTISVLCEYREKEFGRTYNDPDTPSEVEILEVEFNGRADNDLFINRSGLMHHLYEALDFGDDETSLSEEDCKYVFNFDIKEYWSCANFAEYMIDSLNLDLSKDLILNSVLPKYLKKF